MDIIEREKILDDWIAALKSGEYKQGKNFLRKEDEFCCLGVLCTFMGFSESADSKDKLDGAQIYRYDGYSTTVPPIIRSIFSFDETGTIVGKFNLARMNDEGSTFDEIANIIEQNKLLILGV